MELAIELQVIAPAVDGNQVRLLYCHAAIAELTATAFSRISHEKDQYNSLNLVCPAYRFVVFIRALDSYFALHFIQRHV